MRAQQNNQNLFDISYFHLVLNVLSKVLAALSVSLGSLVVGFSSGYTSPALPSMMDPEYKAFNITEQEVSETIFPSNYFVKYFHY